jgi:hypothetical protein
MQNRICAIVRAPRSLSPKEIVAGLRRPTAVQLAQRTLEELHERRGAAHHEIPEAARNLNSREVERRVHPLYAEIRGLH